MRKQYERLPLKEGKTGRTWQAKQIDLFLRHTHRITHTFLTALPDEDFKNT